MHRVQHRWSNKPQEGPEPGRDETWIGLGTVPERVSLGRGTGSESSKGTCGLRRQSPENRARKKPTQFTPAEDTQTQVVSLCMSHNSLNANNRDQLKLVYA